MLSRFLAVLSFLLLAGALATAQVTFTQTSYNDSGSQAIGEASGDFNRDGKPDMAVGTDQGVDIWTNIGSGKFSGPVTYATGTIVEQIAAVDINNDGWLDLVMVSATDYTAGVTQLSTMLNNGDGTFRNGATIAVDLPSADGFAAGDLNRDGKIDLVVLTCDFTTTTAKCEYEVLTGTGTGTFTPGQKLALANTGVTSPQLADINGDGKLDLVNIRVPKVFVWPGTGSGTFGTPTSFQPPAVCTDPNTCQDGLASVAIGDFNNDARLDLAVLQGHYCSGCDTNGSNSLYVYKNNGGLSFSRVATLTPPGSAGGTLYVTDLNGDQNMDLILTNNDMRFGYGEYLLGKGNFAFGSATRSGVGTDADLVVRDFNLDSRHDLAETDGIFPNWYEGINNNATVICPPPSSANLAAKICTPAANASVSSPVRIKASGNSPAGVIRMEIWIDGVKKYQEWNDQVSRAFSLAAGTHHVTAVAVDMYKGTAKKSITITVP